MEKATLAPELARALRTAESLRAALPPPAAPSEFQRNGDEEQFWLGLATIAEACEGEASRGVPGDDPDLGEEREAELRMALARAKRVAACSIAIAVIAVACAIVAWWG